MNCFPVREAWSVQELVFLPTWVSVGIHPWLLSKDHQHHAPKKWDGSDAELVWGRSCPAARERCSGGGCSLCRDPERQSIQDTTRKKAQSELLEILACPNDVLKWIPKGRALA